MSTELANSEPQPASRCGAAMAFTFIAGYVDAYTLLRYHVYASFMSGNTTRAGVQAASTEYAKAALNITAVLGFVAGAFVGVAIIHSGKRSRNVFAAVAAGCLLAIYAVSEAFVPSMWSGVALLSASMGALNSTISRIGGQAVNIGYISGSLHKLAEHLALAWRGLPVESAQGPDDTHGRRAALIASLWGAFLMGAFVGAAIFGVQPAASLYIALAGLLAVVCLAPIDARSS